jgi:geranyl-CoA carboxylase beta subunit
VPALRSRLDPRDPALARNREAQLSRLAEVRRLEQNVRRHSALAEPKLRDRGQILPRERVARLLDPGAPFLELMTLAGLGMHDDDGDQKPTGGGSIVGIGFVSGVRVVVLANDSGIKGGATTPAGLAKSLRAQEIARTSKLPLIHLVESAGANLNYQAEIFVPGGRTFANLARLSAAGIPVISVVHGSSTAGGAYLPGLSDYVIAVKGRAKIFLAGPPLVKAALGQDANDEELGGAEMHAQTTGLAEYLAEDDASALEQARELLASLRWDRPADWGTTAGAPLPRYPAEELLALVPEDYREPYDVREVLARVVDGSELLDFKERYGPHTVCGFAAIEGHRCGILGNNGPIDADGATKAAQFIQLCCQTGTPLVYLQNTTGYMVGRDAESRGIVKHGSKMIQAVANATVPQLTVILGASFGAGNYGMCGRSFDPRFVFAWPCSRIAVMGGDQAAGVMAMVTEGKWRREGKEAGAAERADLERMKQGLRYRLEQESTALYATARVWDDGIIDPRDTRRVLGFSLATCAEAERRVLRQNTFGVARM